MIYSSLNVKSGHIVGFYDEFIQEKRCDNVYSDCMILYGTSELFCFDMLHDIGLGKSISNRPKDVCIADEVDNMLIDCGNFLAKLTSYAPGLELLQQIRQKIWQKMQSICFVNKGKSPDFMGEILIKDMERLINDSKIKLSSHLRSIGNLMLKRWVKSAIMAMQDMHLDVDYRIHGDKVYIIDSSTGVTHKNMRWEMGLHHFLELKHQLPVWSDSLTSLYYSNHRFFTDYGSNIYGLTGTVGSLHTQTFLKEIYNIETLIIPSFKLSQLIIESSIICRNHGDWMTTMINAINNANANGRPVLCILENIAAVKTTFYALNNQVSALNHCHYRSISINYCYREY